MDQGNELSVTDCQSIEFKFLIGKTGKWRPCEAMTTQIRAR